MAIPHDIAVLRDLALRYRDVCDADDQHEKRDLWRRHNSLQMTRPPIYVRAIPRDDEPALQITACEDPDWRSYEGWLRLMLCHAAIGDDYTFDRWISVPAARVLPPEGLWGLRINRIPSPERKGSWMFDPPIKELADSRKMVAPKHEIDEAATAARHAKVQDALGDILPVIVDRAPAWQVWHADIANSLAYLRGLEQIMWDMADNPEWLLETLAFMRDGILAAQAQAEAAGDWRLCDHQNQAMTYAEELPDPAPDIEPVTRKQLWVFCAAQEYAAVSPRMHDEFLLQYQQPIIESFGLAAYGCCEDLTEKIDMLRQLKNLRRIAVAPRANLRRCAEQIGTDYVISWRPNPTETVSYGFDPEHIRRTTRQTLDMTRGQHIDITLKDIETVEGEPWRLREWVRIVREVIDDMGY